MGGVLEKVIPLTYIADVDRQPGAGGTASRSSGHGIGFAGFYSKDAILEAAFGAHIDGRHYRLLARRRRRLPDRVLLLAPAVHDLPRQVARRPSHLGPCPRKPAVMLIPLRAGDRRGASPASSPTTGSSARTGRLLGHVDRCPCDRARSCIDSARGAALGRAAAAGRWASAASRSAYCLLHRQARPAGADRARCSGRCYRFFSTSGISTSSTTPSSSSPR